MSSFDCHLSSPLFDKHILPSPVALNQLAGYQKQIFSSKEQCPAAGGPFLKLPRSVHPGRRNWVHNQLLAGSNNFLLKISPFTQGQKTGSSQVGQFHLLLSQGRLACNKEGQFIIFEKEIIKVRMQFFILLAQEEQVLGPAELLDQVLGLAFMKKQVDLRMPAHKVGLRP